MTLRVLMTVDAVGGVWRYAVDLGRALGDTGCAVTFAGLGPRPTPAQRAEAEAAGRLVWGEAPLDWMAAQPSDLDGVAPWIGAVTRRTRADLIHLNVPSQAAGLPPGPPVVSVCHSCLGTWFRAVERGPAPPHLAWQLDLTRRGLVRADRVVSPSRAHAALTEAVYGLAGITVVPNASAAGSAAASGGDGSVVASARWWDRGKNGAVLDQAAALSGARVSMIGATEGPDGQVFEAAAADLAGPLPHSEALARVAGASVFVSPSLYEPFGLAALEAARMARPLILADIPVYRELWDGAARFFPPRDARSLARLIDGLLRSPGRRRRLGDAARQRARRFTLPAQAEAMREVYDSVRVREGAG